MDITQVRVNFSQTITTTLKEQGRSKKWLREQLEMSAPTLDARLKWNDWRLGEIIKVTQLLGLK